MSRLNQIRRWWVLRRLRRHWSSDQYFLKLARHPKYKWLNDYFNFYERYWFLRMLVGHEQRRGAI
ncbi:hypothetical protein Xmau_03580 [Xenorhabdus mauleonii]|uniref:Uncharacterized protein n=1 Tax=Xenorhabdus mauleonii TaxID=351675 RepID=A0A1I3X208_9GAMM|nr:hypothetical protein [Xenorhabdus mauleonii]PHM38193.1 hypothetical protein Xmau_03580 [Xenorhabdus mauleonii]SFK13684.1 hypothetical protein SAMN05421680_13129 [Xenorhabdus mauleonii]